ncbi:MAG: cupin domain-containing protein [Anaerolineales bacterium]|jgi:quercetin dioxygenase-like cupin family protein
MASSASQTGALDHPTLALGLVEVQSGAVVSRTLVKKASGTVTLFAFDSGEELSEHTAPYGALLYALRGEAEVRISGKPHEVHDGELLELPANQPHALRAHSTFKMMLIMIRE